MESWPYPLRTSELIRGVRSTVTHIPQPGLDGSTSPRNPMRVQVRLLPWRREGGPLVATPLVVECDAPNIQAAHDHDWR